MSRDDAVQMDIALSDANRRLKAIEAHKARLKGLTPDRWLDQRHHAAVLEVNRLKAQIAATRSGFAGHFA